MKRADLHLRRKYNISLFDYHRILVEQGNKCAICKRAAADFSKALAVDHNHCIDSGRLVRGLLCFSCNQLLPARKELIQLLKSAIEYLQNPPAVRVLGERHANPLKRKRKKKEKTCH